MAAVDREESVYMAKLAEQAERYEEMVMVSSAMLLAREMRADPGLRLL